MENDRIGGKSAFATMNTFWREVVCKLVLQKHNIVINYEGRFGKEQNLCGFLAPFPNNSSIIQAPELKLHPDRD